MANHPTFTPNKVLVSIALGALVMGVLVAPTALTGPDKVDICHHPPGNPENVQLISVGRPALPAHVNNHGDFLATLNPNTGELECITTAPNPGG